MSLLDAVLLGIIQGLTEFLPISSSGHLVLGQELLNIVHQSDITFEVFVHFGTLLSVVFMFWKDIKLLFLSIFEFVKNPTKLKLLFKTNEHFKIAIFIVIGSIPAAIVGIMFENEIGVLFNDPKFVSVMLLLTGLILFLTKFSNPKEGSSVGFVSAIIIGIAQAIAIIPGISRSGITISSALFAGISRENAAKFSFLMSLPVIFGASILKANEVMQSSISHQQLLIYFVGTVIAAISGYASIRVVLGLLKKKRFSWFSYYCFIVGILGILFIG
ncbi:MAG: undecaprenyl-diphosphate phosphatase [Bacteroidota bacterium]|nr:undecaprenyl-diphosphate phosphatase [Bacteroidota bacterium]